jgi:hypothetical protein
VSSCFLPGQQPASATNFLLTGSTIKRNPDTINADKQHLDHNLFTVMSQIGTAPSPMLAAARATHRFRRQGGQRKGVHGRLQRCCGQTGVLPYTQC